KGEAKPLPWTTRLDARRLDLLHAIETLKAGDFSTQAQRVVSREAIMTEAAYREFEQRLAALTHGRETLNRADRGLLEQVLYLWDVRRVPFLTEEQVRFVMGRPLSTERRRSLPYEELRRSPLAARWIVDLEEEHRARVDVGTRRIYMQRLPERQEEAAIRRMEDEEDRRPYSLWQIFQNEERARAKAEVPSVFEETRSEVAKITKTLERHDWNVVNARAELGLGVHQDAYEFFESKGFLAPLKKKIVERLVAENWRINRVADRMGVAAGTLQRYMDLLQIVKPEVNREQALEILRRNDWNVDRSRAELKVKSTDGFFAFAEELEIVPELRQVLVARLDASNWAIRPVCDAFGVNDGAVNGWIAAMRLEKPAKTKPEVLAILERHDWNLKKARADLAMKHAQDYFKFLLGVVADEFRAKLRERLDAEFWSPTAVADLFGVQHSMIDRWVSEMGITPPAPIDRAQALAILIRHNWNLRAARADLRRREAPDYEYLAAMDLLGEFKAELETRLTAANGSYNVIAGDFGVTDTTLKKWGNLVAAGQTLPAGVAVDGRVRIIAALGAANWNIPAAQPNMFVPAEADTLRFFFRYGLLRNFDAALIAALRRHGDDPAAIAVDFGVPAAEVTRWLDERDLHRFARAPADTLAILTRNDWNLTNARAELALRDKEDVIDFCAKAGISAEFEAKLTERMTAPHWSMNGVSTAFGMPLATVVKWVNRLQPARPEMTRDDFLRILTENDWNLATARGDLGMSERESYQEFFE
ncbi:MAG: hypothetical protein JO102_04305, partial [Elusimicrobia bacterium]|nr:hypothetical protein [Elusimicrobiota bacterium]